MTKYTAEQVAGVLSRKDVQIFLERRTGLCVGGCGTKVPLEQDAGFIHDFSFAMRGRSLDNWVPESRFAKPLHDKKTDCLWCHRPYRGWIEPESADYSEEIASIHEVIQSRLLVKKGDRWVLGPTK
ncbi:hypothetical protein A2574_03705 [Candidatus Shapirobacteria bacterium RIFOXYD1_FULL_38_32]|uniref:Uncharacterized protein n=2 Tax=Candidatus Shapironibacteriota TaxID=1752721 RepID=A0A1F7SPY8_9BACT|nr:MAG: hypothetical protein UT14_C0025G0006 [Candidatus Shapirobacteria bacterium GW2011_GWE1_38_92]OGL55707.1 MAG: hypothetical protein A2195_02320 [Candidatus Shapirobacteria bacterium RIFOXYA1_FULL_39_17]OGL55823.1 MAG: hypothetical protein A2367_02620 [Candidatus Shapirobacteria bacterium RIFOXYB1_FULL_38_38]OGL56142.1 MAG: hypothetical protein A2410_02830 [Candidatus Shapirobacteria bacterium RIFOXYC1_FULL_38_24]OGL58063.1 MAG: hypothetical protein A2574_03705 [Candidatus Shapirobacteria 